MFKKLQSFLKNIFGIFLKIIHYRNFLRAFYVFMVALLLCIIIGGSFVFWVMQEPRHISYVNKIIDRNLKAFDESISTNIDDSVLRFDSESKKFELQITNITAVNGENLTVVKIPKILVRINFREILTYNHKFLDVFIHDAAINFKIAETYKAADQEKNLTLEEVMQHIGSYLAAHAKLPLNTIKISNSTANFSHGKKDYVLHINQANSDIIYSIGEIDSQSLFDATLNNKPLTLSVQIKETWRGFGYRLGFVNIPSYMITDFLPNNEQTKILKSPDNSFSVTGNFNINTTKSGKLQEVALNIDKAQGSIYFPPYLTTKQNFTALSLSVAVADHFPKMEIDKFNITLASGLNLSASGFVNLDFSDMDLKIEVSNLQFSQISTLWPKEYATDSWNWVMSNVKSADIGKIQSRFKINNESFADGKYDTDAVAVVIPVENARLYFYDNMPLATNVKGEVHINGELTDVIVKNGTVANSQVKAVSITIPYDSRPTTIKGQAEGQANDATLFIPSAILEQIKKAGVNLANGKGFASTNLEITIPSEEKMATEQITYNIKTNLKNFSLPGLLAAYDLTDATATVLYTGREVNIVGTGLVGMAPANFSWVSRLSGKPEFDSEGRINISIYPESLSKLKLDNKITLHSGHLPLDIGIKNKNNVTYLEIASNLDKSDLLFKTYGYHKESGKKANLKANLVMQDGQEIEMTQLNIKGDDLEIVGSAKLSKDFEEIYSGNLDKIKFGRNDFAVKFSKIHNKLMVKLSGNSLDYEVMNIGSGKSGNENKILEEDIEIHVKNAIMKNNINFSNLALNMHCNQTSCINLSLDTDIVGGGHLKINSVGSQGNGLKISAESDNAGAVSNAFNIYKYISKGHLKADAILKKNNGIVLENGNLSLEKFNANKTSIIAKILTLTSLKGIAEVLSGKDISFDKFTAAFTYKNSILDLIDGQTKSSSIGITLAGEVDFEREYIDFSGTVVPDVYGMNKLVGKIPLVGSILLGGEGQGVIAADYKVKGKFGDADVRVNPLSVLAPGILKNLLKIF